MSTTTKLCCCAFRQYKKTRPIHIEDVFSGICLHKAGLKPTAGLKVEIGTPRPPQHSFSHPDQNYAIHFGYAYSRLIPQFHRALQNFGSKMESFRMIENKDRSVSATAEIKLQN